MFWYVLSSILLALGGLLAFLYYYKQGQFDDIEDIKYQMFRDKEEK